MSEEEPRRLKDSEEGPAALRSLLRKANEAVPPLSPELRAAVLASLPAPPSPGTGGGGGAAGGGGASLSPATIGAIGLGVIAIVVGGIFTLVPSDPPAPEVKPAPSMPVTLAPSSAPPPETSATVEGPPPSASASVVVHAPSAKPAPVPSGDSLAEELALITRARDSFGSNPTSTLSLIDDHARRFPNGQLAPEREYLRIRALRKVGRIDEAKARCRAYEKSFPSSPHASSVRAMLLEMESK